MKVNYNEISKKYDDVREADISLINFFYDEVMLDEKTKILDFGCGTGNYANLLQKVTGAKIYGVEPSDGMRSRAQDKSPNISVIKGNHEKIPFKSHFFDFIYMTDVIHHVSDIKVMFKEFKRVLKINGKICIATESHDQIDKRFYVKYFPTTAIIDKKRYPDIDEIKLAAEKESLKYIKSVIYCDNKLVRVDKEFVKLVETKGYSMFHLIDETEYIEGLKTLKNDVYNNEELKLKTSGGTLVWIEKK